MRVELIFYCFSLPGSWRMYIYIYNDDNNVFDRFTDASTPRCSRDGYAPSPSWYEATPGLETTPRNERSSSPHVRYVKKILKGAAEFFLGHCYRLWNQWICLETELIFWKNVVGRPPPPGMRPPPPGMRGPPPPPGMNRQAPPPPRQPPPPAPPASRSY